MLALCLGRGLRAQGVARIGGHSELSVRVEVPAVASPPAGPMHAVAARDGG